MTSSASNYHALQDSVSWDFSLTGLTWVIDDGERSWLVSSLQLLLLVRTELCLVFLDRITLTGTPNLWVLISLLDRKSQDHWSYS